MIWLEDAANLIEEYTDLEDDSPAQDAAMRTAAMYIYGQDGIGRFEVFIATYLYCVDYHDGQWSDEYKVQCQLSTAGLRVQGSIDDQDDSIQDLYARMVQVHHS